MLADRAEAGARADSLHLPLDQTFEVCGGLDREDLKFHARRAGVDDEDRVHGVYAAGSAAMRRRASA